MEIPHPFLTVSQAEFRLYFSMAFIEVSDLFAGAYDLAPFATPGEEGPSTDWIELLYRVARYLHHEHGYRLGSLDVGQGGSITTAGEIEPGNAAYVIMLGQGQLPDLELAFAGALALAEADVPSLPTEPLRAALAQVRRDKAALASLRTERGGARQEAIEREREALRDEALKAVGVVRLGQGGGRVN